MTNALLKVTCEQADDSTLVSVIAFEDAAQSLAALGKGDVVSVSGPCRITEWEAGGELRHGLAVTAFNVMTAYQRRKKQQRSTPSATAWAIYDDIAADDYPCRMPCR